MAKIIGRNAVRESILSGCNIEKILSTNSHCDSTFSNLINLAKERKIKIQFVPNTVLNKETSENHQGIIAYTSDFNYCSVDDILNVSKQNNKPNFIVILDGVEDPHNLGSIIRTCECLGVDGIIIPKNRAVGVTDTVLKVSTGCANLVKIARVTNINQTIEELKKNNIWVYACEIDGLDISSFDLSGNIAVVLGSEGKGVSKLTKSLCDGVFSLKMKGKINSLNVGVATGIALYEISKGR